MLTSKLNKYLTGSGYADKILTVILTVFSSTNIFAHVKGGKQFLVLITSFFPLLFCVSSVVVKKLHKETKTKKKKHNRLLYLAKNNEFLVIKKKKKSYGCQKN